MAITVGPAGGATAQAPSAMGAARAANDTMRRMTITLGFSRYGESAPDAAAGQPSIAQAKVSRRNIVCPGTGFIGDHAAGGRICPWYHTEWIPRAAEAQPAHR